METHHPGIRIENCERGAPIAIARLADRSRIDQKMKIAAQWPVRRFRLAHRAISRTIRLADLTLRHEAALQAAHHGLDNLTAIVDVNALQADGPTAGVLRTEPVTDKWRAFGWHALRVDGNDPAALVAALDRADAEAAAIGQPSVVLCDTKIGYGVPLLETREKAHFMRVAEDEWAIARNQLEESR